MDFLKDRGYKNHGTHILNSILWQKQVSSERVCECNDRVHINVTQYPEQLIGTSVVHESFSVDLTAEVDGVWADLRFYGLSKEELEEKLPELEVTLVRLFNTI